MSREATPSVAPPTRTETSKNEEPAPITADAAARAKAHLIGALFVGGVVLLVIIEALRH